MAGGDEQRIGVLLEQVGLLQGIGGDERGRLVAALGALEGDQLDDDELMALAQAYARAISRVSSAEADILLGRLRRQPPQAREDELVRLLGRLLPLAVTSFATFHPASLERLARRRLAALGDAADPDGASVCVSFVDLCGSTRWMIGATDDDLRALADEVHLVGQGVAARHEVLPAKFLGDGFFLVAGRRDRLVDAAVDAVATLGERTPLRASGGVAFGRVVRRAGDYFGPSVNLAARLAESASAGELLADVEALPDAGHVLRWETIRPRGMARALRVAVLGAPGR